MAAVTGRIEPMDIEQLKFAVSPWELLMRQMAPGRLSARLDFVQVGGILLNHERWSHRIVATGATPPGYLVLAGGYSAETTFTWCEGKVSAGVLAYGSDSAEIDFVVPDNGEHWVVLVPRDLLIDHLGDETAAAVLRSGHLLRCEPSLGRRLSALVDRALLRSRAHGGSQTDDRVLAAIKSQVLVTVAEVLLGSHESVGRSTPRKRYQAFRRAIRYADAARHAVSPPELADAAGVSQRVLQLSFQEALGVAPEKFLRWNRMNGMHRELRHSHATTDSVTEIAQRWHFKELGRTAVEYRRLFGESPSETLSRDCQLHGIRLADALVQATRTPGRKIRKSASQQLRSLSHEASPARG